MRKLWMAAMAAVACAAMPAAATAQEVTEYWGGQMGDNLPKARITFKVRNGEVRQMLTEVRARCHTRDGGPAPNTRLLILYDAVGIVADGFAEERRISHGSAKVEGEFSGGMATGFHKARFRTPTRGGEVRACHTGKQDWSAHPMSVRKWKKFRGL